MDSFWQEMEKTQEETNQQICITLREIKINDHTIHGSNI